jgi:thymidylate synthase ThyX
MVGAAPCVLSCEQILRAIAMAYILSFPEMSGRYVLPYLMETKTYVTLWMKFIDNNKEHINHHCSSL